MSDLDTANATPNSGARGLTAAMSEIDVHLAAGGWDQPPRLFALVGTAELLRSEPALARQQGIDATPDADALTPIEQEAQPAQTPLDEWLAGIGWPAEVFGCALAQEVLTLPPSVEAELPVDADAIRWAASHPLRREVRMSVGVLRDGSRTAVLRLRGAGEQPDDIVMGDDLVPLLADALAATLDDPLP